MQNNYVNMQHNFVDLQEICNQIRIKKKTKLNPIKYHPHVTSNIQDTTKICKHATNLCCHVR